ncbi:Panacea domain-containing protein [Hominisplanchenecus murintestinalis]|uniref:Panacea domain-containing protein n=1 Tax=Hominisplanchenecus murintestinalis TaxID=2941517 RepID=UPI00203C9826|nr:type II toxin-antitoxin system antitoxin SocA domain-containing protein [Hominisplanchenecus murintestinalis]
MVSALSVGNTILKRAMSDGIDITPMKLQKLIYIVYKEYYKRTGRSLFPERFEVWRYGPVLRDVYDTYKNYGANVIRNLAKEADGNIYVVNEDSSAIFKDVMDYTWRKYGGYDGIRLSEMTHKQDTAWYKAAKAGQAFLTDEDIKNEEAFVQ